MKMWQTFNSLYLKNKRLVRYLAMATVIVGIELVVFQLFYIFTRNYYSATIISFVTGVVLNWIGGRRLVFGVSRYHPVHEFIMVLIASVVGLCIQLVVISISVQNFALYPLIGKILSIIFSFFWNYWFRASFIYKNKNVKKSYSSTSLPSIALFMAGGLLASAIFFIRFPNNFIEPNFYAEDGSIFLHNIMQHGFLHAMTTPFNGYFIIALYLLEGVGYIINFIFFHGDFLNLAKSFAITSYLFLGFVCALPLLFFRRHFSIYALAFVLTLTAFVPIPGSDYAVIGTIGNLKFVFVYIAFLLLIYRHFVPEKNWARFIVIDLLLLVSAYTNVVVYLLLPFALVRYISQLRTKKIKSIFKLHSLQSFILLGVLLIPQIIMIKLVGIPPMPGYLDSPYRKNATINLFLFRPYVFPFMSFFSKSMTDIIAAISFVALNVGLWIGLKRHKALYIFGFLTIFLTTLLFVLNRTGVSELFLSYGSSGPDQFFYTQNLTVCFLVGIAVISLIQLIPRLSYRIFVSLLIGAFLLFVYIPASGTYGKNDFMQRTIKNIYVNAKDQCEKTSGNPSIQLYPLVSKEFQLHNVPRNEVCTDFIKTYVPDTEYLQMESYPGIYIPDVAASNLTQTFESDYDGLSGISITFLTYNQPIKDHYNLEVYNNECTQKLRSVSVSPGSIVDTVSDRVNFPRISNSNGKNFCLKLTLQGTKTQQLAVSISQDNVYPEGTLTTNGSAQQDDLMLRLHYSE